MPPNVKFEIDDVESPWLHNFPFDYIFCRYMAACIKDWPKLVENIYKSVTNHPCCTVTHADVSPPQDT